MTRPSASDVERMSAKNRLARAWKPGGFLRQNAEGELAYNIGVNTGETIKRSKHGARKTFYDGQWFDSQLEARCWRDLKLREKAGEIRNLRHHVRFSLFGPGGEHVQIWTADFVFNERPTHHFDHLPETVWDRVVADAKSKYTRKLVTWGRIKSLMRSCHGINVLELP